MLIFDEKARSASVKRLSKGLLLRGLAIPVELQVVTEREFKEPVAWTTSIERQVQQRGVKLFAA